MDGRSDCNDGLEREAHLLRVGIYYDEAAMPTISQCPDTGEKIEPVNCALFALEDALETSRNGFPPRI